MAVYVGVCCNRPISVRPSAFQSAPSSVTPQPSLCIHRLTYDVQNYSKLRERITQGQILKYRGLFLSVQWNVSFQSICVNYFRHSYQIFLCRWFCWCVKYAAIQIIKQYKITSFLKKKKGFLYFSWIVIMRFFYKNMVYACFH